MILYGFIEVNTNKKRSLPLIIVGVMLVILAGLRKNVGADYPVYSDMYSQYFPSFIEYSDLIPKMLLKKTDIEIEWLYIFLNKLVYQYTKGPFFILTLIVASITISIKLITIFKNSEAPVFAILFYFIPGYFIADCGHMRQALGMTFVLFSFEFIKQRKVLWYLLCMYIAFGFHKSSCVFLPAYWFATVNLNSWKILVIVLISMVLSPFQVYQSFSSFLDTLSVQEISAGYTGYIDYEMETSGVIKFMDVVTLFYVCMMVLYDKETCEKIPYYEYMRNIGVLGICVYFIMRENPVFSTRLVGPYYLYLTIVMSNIFVSINNKSSKRILLIGYMSFVVFYYFTFARYQGNSGRFTPSTYQNFLWN